MLVALTALGIFLAFIGVIGLAIPFIPDVPLIVSGVLLVLIGQNALSPIIVIALVLLAVLAFLADWLLVVYGARKLGATRAGEIGGLIGLSLSFLSSFVGTGVIGIVLFPAIGATIGEIIGRRQDKSYNHAPVIGLGIGLFAAMATTIKIIMVSLIVMVGVIALVIGH